MLTFDSFKSSVVEKVDSLLNHMQKSMRLSKLNLISAKFNSLKVYAGPEKVPYIIEFLIGITLKIQLKGVLFSGHPVYI